MNVFTHGGGWAAGNRYKAASGSFATVFKRLIKERFAVAPVTYRLAKADSAVTMRDCVTDCKDAIRYLAKNSELLGTDPKHLCVMGDSAGGHIAQMLLLSSPEGLLGDPALSDASYRMVAGVSWYGPCDFEKMDLFNHNDYLTSLKLSADAEKGWTIRRVSSSRRYSSPIRINSLRGDSLPAVSR